MDIIALIVFAEAIASLVLWLAAFALALAIYAVTGFTAIWGITTLVILSQ